MRAAMSPVRRAQEPIAQSKQHGRYGYSAAKIGGRGPDYVSEPPLDTLIEGARIAEIRGPERLPPNLAADEGKRDAEDRVDLPSRA